MMRVFGMDEWIPIGGDGPWLPRLTLDQDQQCLDRSKIVNLAIPGDSIDVGFWFTPTDTVVTDTIRGLFKVYYRGQILPPDYVPVERRESDPTPRWTASGLVVPNSSKGPFQLRDLRGRSFPLRSQEANGEVRLIPQVRIPRGVYRLTWPEGSATVLNPGG